MQYLCKMSCVNLQEKKTEEIILLQVKNRYLNFGIKTQIYEKVFSPSSINVQTYFFYCHKI